MATGAEAGWYDDGTGKQRWWDGSRWTEEYVDLNERWVELHSGAPPAGAPARRGWYDDGRGRLRWWNGRHWTNDTRFSGTEESFSGIVVDGRWIHFGGLSEPIAGSTASYATGAELLKRARLSRPAVARTLYGPLGLITPRLLQRSVFPTSNYLLVEVSGQVWLGTIPAGQDTEARRFIAWINSVSDHYRYR
jgi:hypothetical protein